MNKSSDVDMMSFAEGFELGLAYADAQREGACNGKWGLVASFDKIYIHKAPLVCAISPI